MLMIRLQRVGRRNHAEFRVVVTEKTRAAKSSNYVELVGNYNPHTDVVNFKEDRIKYWMSVGAKVSDTVHNLLVSKKIIKGDKINVLPKKSPIVKEEEEKEEKTEEETSNEEVSENKEEEKTEEKKEETNDEATDAESDNKEEEKEDAE